MIAVNQDWLGFCCSTKYRFTKYQKYQRKFKFNFPMFNDQSDCIKAAGKICVHIIIIIIGGSTYLDVKAFVNFKYLHCWFKNGQAVESFLHSEVHTTTLH